MCKKIHSYIVVIGLCNLFGGLFGMDRDEALRQLIRKEVNPVLALNNYIVNVPTAYQALQKEASLSYIALKNMKYGVVEQINENNRSFLKEKGGHVYTVDVSEESSRFFSITGSMCSKQIKILYKPALDCSGNCDAYINIQTSVYYISHSRLLCKQVPATGYFIKNKLSNSLRKELGSLLQEGHPVYIELSSHNNFSDWIRLTKIFRPVEDINPEEDGSLLLKKLCLEDSSLFHSRDLDYNKIDLEGFRIGCCSLIFTTTVLATVFLGLSLYS